jgi:hypothetical protein
MRPSYAALRGPRRAWRLATGLAGLGAVVVAGAVTVPVTTTGCATHQCDGENVTFDGGYWVTPTQYVTSDWNEDWIPYPGAINLTVNFPPGGVAPGRGPVAVHGYVGTGVSPNNGTDFQGGEDWTEASGQLVEYYFLSPTGFTVGNGTCGNYYARFEVDFAPPGLTVFGGTAADGSTPTDTWTWNGSAWTSQGPMDPRLGPEERTGASMVSLGGMTYVFAGLDPTGLPGGPGQPRGTTYLGDMWSFDGSSWSQIFFTPTAAGQPWPAGRVDATTVALGKEIVVFGGHGEDGTQPAPYPIIDISDTWTWDGNPLDPWSLLSISGPSGRSGAAAAVTGSTMVLFGGTAGGSALGDTWTFDGNAWTQVAAPSGSGAAPAPSARFHAAAAGVTDPATGNAEVLLFGGDTGTTKLGDTWLWDGTKWTQATYATSPAARAQASIGVLNGTVVLFGGVDANGKTLGDTWTWTSLGGWLQSKPSTSAVPAPRYGAAASGP